MIVRFATKGSMKTVKQGCITTVSATIHPMKGCISSQDPIGLAGNNPTLYGYVSDTNSWVDTAWTT